MGILSKLINLIRQSGLMQGLLAAAIGWLVLGIVCCVFGAAAFYTVGRKKGIKPYLPAFLPGGQIWYTLKLAGKDRAAGVAEHLMWWCPALLTTGGAALIWAAYFYILDSWGAFFGLVIPGVLLLLTMVGFYISVRVMELRGLWVLLNRWQWAVSLIGTLVALPIQRIILFAKRNQWEQPE